MNKARPPLKVFVEWLPEKVCWRLRPDVMADDSTKLIYEMSYRDVEDNLEAELREV